jgi:hypothetical protein
LTKEIDVAFKKTMIDINRVKQTAHQPSSSFIAAMVMLFQVSRFLYVYCQLFAVAVSPAIRAAQKKRCFEIRGCK